MKRSTRIWIGGVAAVATFASLAATVGMRRNHCNNRMMGQHHSCAQHCESEKKIETKSSVVIPADNQANHDNKVKDSESVQNK